MATLILKATEKCNSNCYYCDVVTKKDAGKSMSLEVLETTLSKVDEYLKEKPGETVELLWHGGEPLLLGPDYFRSAIELQSNICAGTKDRILHSMQTNLTCLTNEFMDIFRELGIHSVGSSYDPEPHIRGAGQGQRDSEEYNRRFMEATRLLDRQGIGWGLIYVVTKKSLTDPLKAFHFLANLVLTGGFNMNPVLIYDEHRKDVSITPREYVDFLGAIFPAWWEHRGRYPDVQPFQSLVDNIVNGNTSLGCVDSGRCTYVHINVAPDGETSQCGRSSDWGLLSYGNIADRSLVQILSDSQRDELDERLKHLQEGDCKDCRFWTICHGGCPLDSWSEHNSFMHKTGWCEAKIGFIEEYFEPVTGVKFEPKQD